MVIREAAAQVLNAFRRKLWVGLLGSYALAVVPDLPIAQAAEPVEASGIKILLIGATSRAGAEIIPQAIAQGHQVVGLARRPEEVTFTHERFTAVKGDVYDIASLEAVLDGVQVVISMVGPKPILDPANDGDFGPTELVSQGTANIIQAMKNRGAERLIVASSSLAEIIPVEGPPAADATPYKQYIWAMRTAYQDDRDMEAIVRVSGLETVVLRPGFLIDAPKVGNLQMIVTNQGRAKLTPKRTLLTYADFAAFTVEQAVSNEFIGKTIGMYTDVCPPGSSLQDWGCVNN
jgi:putative NADH-flavin reductase